MIVCREDWERTQELLKKQSRQAWGNRPKHRYAGLLRCAECGNTFVPQIRYWNGTSRVEYICRGYQRNRKNYCPSHRIHEETLDAEVIQYIENRRSSANYELAQLTELQRMWALRKPILDSRISALEDIIRHLEQEIDEIVIEKIRIGT